ncbi:DUF1508 domain-containing protein [Pseudomonas sp. Irchel 3E20]|uniref:YegP family protein n=1 Tax=Pseudomonas sp. Irchel 3E20 TaxID=2008983 RepID=UPI000BA4A432|nr:DUF1508 domain-containing protein [Pseudomonas sp. Irchel 3E20]
MYFEIYQQTTGTSLTGLNQWRWRLKAGNHEPIASGEAYHNKADCLHAITLIVSTHRDTPVKEVAAR